MGKREHKFHDFLTKKRGITFVWFEGVRMILFVILLIIVLGGVFGYLFFRDNGQLVTSIGNIFRFGRA